MTTTTYKQNKQMFIFTLYRTLGFFFLWRCVRKILWVYDKFKMSLKSSDCVCSDAADTNKYTQIKSLPIPQF